MSARRYELTDFEWSIIEPLQRASRAAFLAPMTARCSTASTGVFAPALHGLHSGALRAGNACYNRFVRWRKLGVWDRIFAAISAAYDGDLQMVDNSSIRVHQHAANVKKRAAKKPPLGTSLMSDAWGARGAD